MRKLILILMFCVACAGLAAQSKSIYDFTIKSIDGQQVSLGGYSGKVVLLVNEPVCTKAAGLMYCMEDSSVAALTVPAIPFLVAPCPHPPFWRAPPLNG